jgi:hypothetical protein
MFEIIRLCVLAPHIMLRMAFVYIRLGKCGCLPYLSVCVCWLITAMLLIYILRGNYLDEVAHFS